MLFGIHDIRGAVTHYVPIARSIGPEQTVYALQARGSETDDAPHTDLASMAACYIDAIREVQPDGPYSLVGYSFGGHVAFEMAQQLRAQGRDVAHLIFLDTHRWINPQMPNGEFDEAIFWSWWLAANFNLSRQQRKSLFDELRILDFDQRVEDIVGRLKLSGLEKYDIPAARLRQKLRVQVSNARALFDYKPEQYPFRITLVAAEESRDVELGWRELATGGLDIHHVPGDHKSILRNPAVGDVIRKCLAKVERARA